MTEVSGFMTLKKPELMAVAKEFGTDFDEAWTKPEIIKAMEDDGVYWDDYQRFVKTVDDENERLTEETLGEASHTPATDEAEEKEEEKGDRILIRMIRKNPTYDIRGARFTQAKPFAFLEEDDAEWVIENVEGFRIALPKEVRAFYGK